MKALPFKTGFDNTVSAWIPEIWAQETLVILEEVMVMGNLVHRDFSADIANFGETVHTRKPAEFKAVRKGVNDNVTVQAVSATDIPVVLNQHIHTSFLIRDGEESKSFRSLVDEYLAPAALSLGREIDLILSSQVHRYLDNSEGHLGMLDSTNGKEYILGARERLNILKAPVVGRNLVIGPQTETQFLLLPDFTQADKVGDAGTALREASLGRKLGFDTFMAQNTVEVTTVDGQAGAVNSAGGLAAGTTVVPVDGFTTTGPAVGSWVTIVGDDIPRQIVASTVTAGAGNLTLASGLKRAVADNAVVQAAASALVNNASGYAAGYDKEIAVDGYTGVIPVGSLMSFGTDADRYGVIGTTESGGNTVGVTLDRPLVAALTDNEVVGVGPSGKYNFAFNRTAIALVVRPLAMPRAGAGALSGTASHNNLALRVVVTYDGDKQGHLVTLDLLAGVAQLEPNVGVPLLG